MVAWSLTITDLDPIRLGLLFERFLNPERVSMPDFDIDFCETRRGEVIRYVQERYGADKVAQIITFGKLKARAVLKDTGRVLQMTYGQVDRLAKLIPNHPTDPWTLERALNGVSELAAEYQDDAEVRRLFDLAMKLEGLPRHASTHAAGVVIGDRPLDAARPALPRSALGHAGHPVRHEICRGGGAGEVRLPRPQDAVGAAEGGRAAGQARHRGRSRPADAVGRSGGLRTAPARRHGRRVPAGIGRHAAHAGGGEADQLRRHHRARLALPAGADGQYPDVRRPQERPRADRLSASAARGACSKETYGIFVYQEQVMEAAKVLAGFSLGEADLLRRAMGKKIKSEMDAQRAGFVDGCARVNDIPAAKANELFDLIDKFAGYGFNKSHAAAYALVAYQTAWLKAHHPVEFYAASMCFDMHQTDKLAIFVDDMRRMRRCVPAALDQRQRGRILGRAARRGPRRPLRARRAQGRRREGDGAAGRGAAARTAPSQASTISPRGSIRACSTAARSKASPAAARSTASPSAGRSFAAAETILSAAASAADARVSGQGGLFGEGPANVVPIRMPTSENWTLAQRMAAEKESFGFYFSAHPVDNYRHLAAAHGAAPLRRSRRAAGAGRRRPHRRGDGRPGRGHALAHLGARAAAT